MSYKEIANMTGLNDIFIYANNVSDNIFGNGILVSVFFIVILYLKGKGESTGDSIVVASFFMATIAMFLFFLSLIEQSSLIIAVVIMAVSVLFGYLGKG